MEKRLGLLALLLLGALAFPVHAVPASVGSGVVDTRLSYGYISYSYNTVQVQQAALSMLYSTDARCVRVDLGYAPWLQNDTALQQEAISLIDGIKSSGHCLILADAASETYRSSPLPWSQFEQTWAQRVRSLATLFHPDYYIVIKEPGWYYPMIAYPQLSGVESDYNLWVGLAQNLSATVKAASPSTQVGVSVDAGSLGQYYSFYAPMMQGIAQLPQVDFLGFDIYGTNYNQPVQNFLSQYSASGKSVWVAEAWSTPDGSALNGSPQADATWVGQEYQFAQGIGAAFFVPFYTDDFASYSLGSMTSSLQIISAYQTARTPVYDAYRTLTGGVALSSTITTLASSSSTFTLPSLSGTHITKAELGFGVFAVIAIVVIALVARSGSVRWD